MHKNQTYQIKNEVQNQMIRTTISVKLIYIEFKRQQDNKIIKKDQNSHQKMGTHQHTSSKLIDLHISDKMTKQNAQPEKQNEDDEDEEIFNPHYTPSLVFTQSVEKQPHKQSVHQISTPSVNKQLSIIQEDSDEFSKFSSFNLSSFRKMKEKQKMMHLQHSDGLLKNQAIPMSTTSNQKSGKSPEEENKIKRSQLQNYNLPSIEEIYPGSNLDDVQNRSSARSSSSIENSNVREIIYFNVIDDQFAQEEETSSFKKCLSLSQVGSTSYRQLRNLDYQSVGSMFGLSSPSISKHSMQSLSTKFDGKINKNVASNRPKNLLYF